MLPKTKATKMVDDWYKKIEVCSTLPHSSRECSTCDFARQYTMPVNVGGSYDNSTELALVDVCDLFNFTFNKIQK